MSDHAAAIRGLPRWHPNPHVRAAIETIRKRGWQTTAVSQVCECGRPGCPRPECTFAYTAGLGLHDIPELAVYGLDAATGTALLDELIDVLHRYDWRRIVASRTEVLTRAWAVPIRLVEILDKDDLLMANLLFPDSPALQAVWPDENGHYPWHPDYLLLPMHQPLKGVHDVDASTRPGPRVITPARSDRTWPQIARRVAGH